MIATMLTGDPDPEDVANISGRCGGHSSTSICGRSSTRTTTERVSGALPRADGYPRWGPGERLVFEPYSKERSMSSFAWIEQHGIFPRSEMGSGKYETAIFA